MAVLVTRPDERGKALVESLNQAGIVALHLPLFRLEAGTDLVSLPSQLSQLNAGDYVFFVSKSAVDFAHETLKNVGFRWREDLHFFTVGRRTAQHFSCQSEGNIQYPIASENSEGLLALPAMQDLTGKNVLVLRGNGGRDLFPEQAQLRGANVTILEVYQRTPIECDYAEQTSIFKRSGVQTIIATSQEIVRLLLELIPEEEQAWLKSCTLVTVSQRIADFAKQSGWQQVIISPKADNDSLLHTLLNEVTY